MSGSLLSPAKIHILNHHVWPDGSPVCIAAEQVVVQLAQHGVPVVMVGSSGKYRSTVRQRPDIEIVTLKTRVIKRDNVFQNIAEYLLVFQAFWKYIRQSVQAGDLLIVTSAPPINALLRYAVRKRKVKTVFWLFDYFPAYSFPLGLPKFLYNGLCWLWDKQLNKYDHVIKIAGNLGYWGKNAIVHRLWPTISIQPNGASDGAKKVLYSGNLGMAHDVQAVIQTCESFREQGFDISIHADGPGVEKLPNWLKAKTKGLLATESTYREALYSHDVHLVAGTPGSDVLSFPSKIWNSLAAGKKVVPCGFYGKMEQEYELVVKSDFNQHLSNVTTFIKNVFYKS